MVTSVLLLLQFMLKILRVLVNVESSMKLCL